MMRYIFATNNPSKVKELKAMFEEAKLEMLSLADFGLSFEPTETGDTFEENATQKVTKTAQFLKENGIDCEVENIAVLSDDSGLCIDALNGLPGVASANFMGRELPYTLRNSAIIDHMKDTKENERAARFVCVIACLFPCGKVETTNGTVEGQIAYEAKGENGFGYDPIFFVPKYGKTTAELSQEEKNKISHRGNALQAMIEKLKVSV